MMYKCSDCGCIFDEEDAGTYQESRGEFWGAPCSETLMCCPECRSEYIEECDEYDECWITEDYDLCECESCPHKSECDGYKEDEEDGE